jgi:hypothetical protein
MEDEVFMWSPLPEDRRPRKEVIAAYFDRFRNPDDESCDWVDMTMTGVSFYANDFQLWGLILELVDLAPDDDDMLQNIAAGPLESFLGRFDDGVIERVEQEASRNEKFHRTLSGVWKHGMCDATWNRVRAIQATVAKPLPEMIPFESDESRI